MSKSPIFLWFLALFLGACASRTAVPRAAAPSTAGDFGVLIMAHGGPPEWNAGVLETAKPLASKYAVEVAFGMADAASLQDGVRRLEARGVHRIGVVRLFISGESWYERTEQILGITPGAPPAATPSAPAHAGHAGHAGHSMEFFRVASTSSFALSKSGLADAPQMGNVLADRAAALSHSPEREDVLILAHGPEDDGENQRWLEKLSARAEAVRTRAPFRRVQVETLREDWPDKRVDAEKRIREYVSRASAEGGAAIVIPFRVQGFGPYAEVLKDLTYVSDGRGLIPHKEVTDWLEREAANLAGGAFRVPLAPDHGGNRAAK